MRKKVSATIVTYRGFDKVSRAIKSIIDNTKGVDLKLYIVDNASPDGTPRRIMTGFPSVEVIERGDNSGFGRGHNEMLAILESDYHTVINPDIVLTEDVLTQLADYLDNNPDIGLVTPKILNSDGSDQRLPKRDPTVAALVGRRIFGFLLKKEVSFYGMEDKDLSVPQDIEFATGCFFMMRTSLFKQLKGFDPRFFLYYEDMDITRRARKFARTVYYPDTYVYHDWERSSAHSIKYFSILVAGMFKYFNKWGWRFFYPKENKKVK